MLLCHAIGNVDGGLPDQVDHLWNGRHPEHPGVDNDVPATTAGEPQAKQLRMRLEVQAQLMIGEVA